ncbi:oligopeptide transporter [Salinisphaera sp. T5B8]|uniref:OPT family oligopeptide transporter n=1 Tax=Salinisphaera sp. T5B8 TaxID=1304154 RepID=UPI003342D35B
MSPVSASHSRRQLTPRAVVLGLLLAIVLSAANAYLGLFAGLTVSASIPAAVLSLGILRLFADANVLENNIVQTAASAGEAIAAGVIFTLPALVMLGYWSDFPYFQTLLIAGVGGLLGVLMTVPLRRALVDDSSLAFPEGQATAAVLKAGYGGTAAAGIGTLLSGAALGAIAKLGDSGLRLWQGTVDAAVAIGQNSSFYVGSYLSPALLAVGYIVGINIALAILIGGLFAWWVAIPAVMAFGGVDVPTGVAGAQQVWSDQIRYLGVGAMLVGGLAALWTLRGQLFGAFKQTSDTVLPSEKDLPRALLLGLLVALAVPMSALYSVLLGSVVAGVLVALVMLGAAFLFSAVAAYMAGLVGSSNNPVSGVTIATILITALGLYLLFGDEQAGPASALIVGAVVCCAAAIGGDNMQDLKAGAILGASPAAQQIAQMLGVIAAVCVLSPVLSLLLNAYGIGVSDAAHPHALPAPQASLMVAVVRGVFHGGLPWAWVVGGGVLALATLALDALLAKRGSGFRMPVLAVALGLYLPLSLSMAIAVGGFVAWLAGSRGAPEGRGLLAAAGIITGEALMGIFIALPVAFSGSSDVLALDMPGLPLAWPGALLMVGLGVWLWRLARQAEPKPADGQRD